MNVALKILYVGAALLAVVALLLGSYDYFFEREGKGNLLVDVILPLGMLVVVVLLYRRRKRELEAG